MHILHENFRSESRRTPLYASIQMLNFRTNSTISAKALCA